MKRTALISSLVIVIVLTGVLFFLRSSSGFRSVYLVPNNAVLLVETKDPVGAWNQIVYSKAWEHLSTNPALAELNTDIQSYDSLLSSSRFITKLLGEKPVMLSQHRLKNGNYEYLYIVELGKLGKYKKPEKLLKPVLGDEYELTSREFESYTIAEILDIEAGSYYFLSLIEGKLIFSLDPKLIEASILASKEKKLGREKKFYDVYSKVSAKGLVSIYINHKNLGPYIKTLSSEAQKQFARNKHLQISGISFDIDQQGLITIEGYSSLADSAIDIYKEVFTNGNQDLASAAVVPTRLASMAKINFDDADDYFHSTMKAIGQNEYSEYVQSLSKLEKKFNFSLEDNFFSWMDKEIVMLQTQPSNLGRSNEFAVVLPASDSAKASDNLKYLWRQIKKNSPVKVKSVPYRNYQIDYIAFPGLLKTLFGKALSKIEKPYFTQIDSYVIISNHPQTLKNLIDDYLEENTLKSSVDYYNFDKLFETKTGMYSYFKPPVLYFNLKDFLSPQSWSNLKNNKDYFTCFSQAGMQLAIDGELVHYTIKAKYKPEESEWKKQYYNSFTFTSLFSAADNTEETVAEPEVEKWDTVPHIIIHSLDNNKQEEFFDDGTLYRVVEIKNGQKHGNFKEYYPSGELKMKGSFEMDRPSGKWKYYNEEGKQVKLDKY